MYLTPFAIDYFRFSTDYAIDTTKDLYYNTTSNGCVSCRRSICNLNNVC